jgi:C-terminal processing protease CtpA/Prc
MKIAMKLKSIVKTFFILAICTSCVFFQNSIKLTVEEQNLAEFNLFIADFESNFIYLNKKKELFDCVKSTYREKVSTIASVESHIKFYETLLNELYDSHIHLNTNTEESYRLAAPIFVKTANQKTTITNVWQTQLATAPRENIIGAEILSLNGLDFQRVIDQFPTVCQDKNNEEIRNWISNKVLAGKRNEPRVLKIKLTTGELIDFNLDDLEIRKEKYFLTPKIIDDKIGYVRINNTLGNEELVKEFDRIMKNLYSTEALILDLRNTPDGGNTQTATPIMGRFISEKERYQLYESSQGESFGYVKPRKPIYNNPLYVLVNRWTGSMAEGMAIGFDGMKRATIIGTEMQRLAGGMKSIQFKYHPYSFRVSIEKTLHIDGSPRENFIPKDYIEQTQLITDEILDYTLDLINNRQ